TSVTAGPIVGSGPEGIAFVPPSSPVFTPYSVLIALYSAGKVITAPLDSNGDPIMTSAQDFIKGLSGAEGAFIDPLTGDFLFSTFGSSNQVIRVSGFIAPTAGEASVSGRVADASGRGVYGARVSLSAADGKALSAITNNFGYYRIDGVSVGETYVAGVTAKRYTFRPRVVTISDDLAGLDFVEESTQYILTPLQKTF
ncbi:MAG TPA: carboxypeptidase-like regulatory domain-containing protein, partial [Pyrinomonadaceae bacterium]|nr:carboxypeptidase-like regulatory domain-containing protein [Pyrinomonadaceae bacterium]